MRKKKQKKQKNKAKQVQSNTPVARTLVRKKSRLYKKWIISKSNVDEVSYRLYKKYLRKLKKAEIISYSSQFDSSANSIKQIWSNLNCVCSGNKNRKDQTVINEVLYLEMRYLILL